MAVSREKLVKTAEKYVSRGKVEAAIKEYRKLLEDNPRDTNTLNRVGDLYARLQKLDDAVKLFVQIADQYTEEGFFVKAIAIYKKIIKLDPTRLEVYEKLAELYHRQGLVNEARTQYQVLADYYVKHDNAASAISIYQHMVELEPDDPAHHAKLAELYQKQQLLDKAADQYHVIADLMLAGGHVTQVVQVYERALDIASEDLDFIATAVGKLRRADQPGGAARLLAVAVERNPEARSLASDSDLAAAQAARREAPPPRAPARAEPMQPETVRPEAAAPEPTPEEADSFTTSAFGSGDLEAALAEASAAVDDEEGAEAGADDGSFELGSEELVLEWEDEQEEFESQIKPPEDMDEGPGIGFRREEEEEEDAAGTGPAATAPEEPAAAEPRDAWSVDFAAGTEAEGVPEPEVIELGDFEDLELPEVSAEGEAAQAAESEAPEAAGLGAGGEVDLELDLDLELDDLDFEEEPPVAEDSGVEPIAFDAADGETAEEEPDEVEAEPALADEDYLSEAEVLAKYGLREKAYERVHEVLAREPTSLAAHRLLIHLHVEEEDEGEVRSRAMDLARLAADQGRPEVWQQVRAELLEAGYSLAEDEVVAAPAKPPPKRQSDRISRLLETLLDDAPKPKKRRPKTQEEEIAAILGQLPGQETKRKRETAEPEAPPEPEAELRAEPEAEAPLEPLAGAPPAAPILAEPPTLPGPPAPLEAPPEPGAEVEPAPRELERALKPLGEIDPGPEPEVGAREDMFDLTELSQLVEEDEEEAPEVAAALGEAAGEEPTEMAAAAEEPAAEEPAAEAEPALEAFSLGDLDDEQEPALAVTDEDEDEDEELRLPEDLFADSEPAAAASVVGPAAEGLEQPVEPIATAEPEPLAAAEPEPAESTEAEKPDDEGPLLLEDFLAAETMPEGEEVRVAPLSRPEDEQHSDIEGALASMEPVDPAAAGAQGAVDDTGTSWLDEVTAEREGGAGTGLFDDEAGFFDLASELEDELTASEATGDAGARHEPSLEEIVEGFKQGVAEALSEEDYDTHFNLGIAYREMGLMDEAIGEFQLAAKSPQYLVHCCSMLGMSFQEKGLPELAVKWYTRGLSAPEIGEEDSLALLYDLGNVYLASGDEDNARKTFVEIYGINSNYRDVSAKLVDVGYLQP